jgi:SAM-dependent methyltransferase
MNRLAIRRRLRRAVLRARHFGWSRRCVVCSSRLRAFLPFGRIIRVNAICPICGALERHRQAWLFFRRETDLFDGQPKRILHLAPEPELADLFRAVPNLIWVGADLRSPLASVRADVTRLPFLNASFDLFYCSHVLEHIPDDMAALEELCRVLKGGGWGTIQVPMSGLTTREDPSVTDPAERERLFGQHDHVRLYGEDFILRLRRAGFEAEAGTISESLDSKTLRYFGLSEDERLYRALKSCERAPA